MWQQWLYPVYGGGYAVRTIAWCTVVTNRTDCDAWSCSTCTDQFGNFAIAGRLLLFLTLAGSTTWNFKVVQTLLVVLLSNWKFQSYCFYRRISRHTTCIHQANSRIEFQNWIREMNSAREAQNCRREKCSSLELESPESKRHSFITFRMGFN